MDGNTFVKSILAAMWMLNDVPRQMRKDLHTHLEIIRLLISDPKVFPSITFTPDQQKAICEAMCNQAAGTTDEVYIYTYDALTQQPDLKVTVATQET